jgi:hypothetical protein
MHDALRWLRRPDLSLGRADPIRPGRRQSKQKHRYLGTPSPATQSMHVEFSDTAKGCVTRLIITAFGVGRKHDFERYADPLSTADQTDSRQLAYEPVG